MSELISPLDWWMNDPAYVAHLHREYRRLTALQPLLRFLRR